ncbi:AI-2E family transporter [Candidatus Microgenomates bacterium]|nr:AI-2E family transporter [Candidatus Microgenomates bacterium]
MKKLSNLLSVKTNITHISNHVIIRFLTITLAFVLAIAFFWVTRQAWVLIMISFFLALALSQPVNWLAPKLPKQSRILATGLVYLVVLALVSLLIVAVLPPLIDQTKSFVKNFPQYIEDLETADTPVARFARRYDIPENLRNAKDEIATNLSKAGGPILGVAKRIVSSVAATVTILVLTFFMVVEGPKWLKTFWELHDPRQRAHRQELARRMYRVVTRYVNGQLLIATLGSLSAFIAMTVARLPFALPIAGIVWVLELIPLIGATLGGIIIVLAALFFKTITVAVILGIYLILYQQFENAFIQPMVQAKAVNLTPLLILVSAIVGATLAGLLGALLAIPVAACAKIIVSDFVDRHHLRHKQT